MKIVFSLFTLREENENREKDIYIFFPIALKQLGILQL